MMFYRIKVVEEPSHREWSKMQKQTTQEEYTGGQFLRITGIVTIITAVLTGVFGLFVVPAACSAIVGLMLLFSGFLLVGGFVALIVGLFKR